MAREVDERKTKRALARLNRAKAEAESRGETLSGWETEFIDSVETRLKTYGSAFADPEKGDLAEPLSGRQRVKLKEIDKKARGRSRRTGSADAPEDGEAPKPRAPMKPRKPLQAKKPMNRVSAKRAKDGRAKTGGAKQGWTPRVRDISAETEDLLPDDRPRPGPPKLRLIDGGGA